MKNDSITAILCDNDYLTYCHGQTTQSGQAFLQIAGMAWYIFLSRTHLFPISKLANTMSSVPLYFGTSRVSRFGDSLLNHRQRSGITVLSIRHFDDSALKLCGRCFLSPLLQPSLVPTSLHIARSYPWNGRKLSGDDGYPGKKAYPVCCRCAGCSRPGALDSRDGPLQKR